MSAAPHTAAAAYDHVYLGAGHARNERRTWLVIGLCLAMMIVEIVGGLAYGSIALVADGLHMSTHAGALLLAALAYTYSRNHARDPRFSFGTGKLGDLAGFTSAIVLAMIALAVGYESAIRLFAPVPIRFGEAIPIATLGLAVNVASGWLLSGGHDHAAHGHGHGGHDHAGHDHAGHDAAGHDHGGHGHGDHDHGDHDHAAHVLRTRVGEVMLAIHKDGAPPRFRLTFADPAAAPAEAALGVLRPDGTRQAFRLVARGGGMLESIDPVPEPHAFEIAVEIAGETHGATFAEARAAGRDHHRDNNMRAALVHVIADAAVSVLVIAGLLLARRFGWLWLDPAAGLVGAVVIASWAWGLVRDTGAILLDMEADPALAGRLRRRVEAEGDAVADLHLWRLGPGHLGAIVAIATRSDRTADFYRGRLAGLPAISHLTVDVTHVA